MTNEERLSHAIELSRLQADNIKLREAVYAANKFFLTFDICNEASKLISKALSSTPEQSLKEHESAAIEDYKASLVPVAVVNKNTPSWYLQELVNVFKLENGTPLYALPKETP